MPTFSLPATLKKRKIRYRLNWLRPFWSSTATMKRIVDKTMAAGAQESPVVLNMMFHSMELVPGANPYTKSDADVRAYLASLGELLDHCRQRGVVFVGLEGVHARFQP